MTLVGGSTQISRILSLNRCKKFLDRKREKKKYNKSFLLSPQVENSRLLPERLFTNQNFCLEEKMPAYIALCALLLEPGRSLAELEEAVGQGAETGLRVPGEGGEEQEGRLLIPPPLNMLSS